MSIPTRIVYADYPADRRVIAISDVHGNLDHLTRLLDSVRFTPEDVLVLVGDLVSKGPRSLDTLRHVMALSRTHTVHALLGNVDIHAVEKMFTADAQALCAHVRQLRWRENTSLADECARALGITLSPDMDLDAFRDRVGRAFSRELAFLRGLPTILQTPRHTFVHGGIPPGPVAALAGQDAYRFTKRDAFLDEGLVMDRLTIVGHWPTCLYGGQPMTFAPVYRPAQRTLAIDGGCGLKDDGQLNAVVLEGDSWTWRHYGKHPTRTARDAQAASDTWHSFTYMQDPRVDILARKEGAAQVRHRATGRMLWVPEGCLYTREGEDHPRCADITDYRLPVAPGDTLTVLHETGRGCLCKRDGVLGWYGGGWR